jgi:hypothetical protein
MKKKHRFALISTETDVSSVRNGHLNPVPKVTGLNSPSKPLSKLALPYEFVALFFLALGVERMPVLHDLKGQHELPGGLLGR